MKANAILLLIKLIYRLVNINNNKLNFLYINLSYISSQMKSLRLRQSRRQFLYIFRIIQFIFINGMSPHSGIKSKRSSLIAQYKKYRLNYFRTLSLSQLISYFILYSHWDWSVFLFSHGCSAINTIIINKSAGLHNYRVASTDKRNF